MRNQLDIFESRLQKLIEGIPQILWVKQPADISHQVRLALQAAQDDISSDGSIAENFILHIHPETFMQLQNPQELLESLTDALQQLSGELNLPGLSEPSVSLKLDPSLEENDIRISISPVEDRHGHTEAVHIAPNPLPESNAIPHEAYLIIDGKQTYPLTLPVINIGRRADNHLVIEDLRISRTHSQLRAIRGKYVIFDVGSTGGTFVNGQRINQTTLTPGDVISLAGLTLIYSETCPDPTDHTDRMPKL